MELESALIPPFDPDADVTVLADRWTKWRRHVELYLETKGITSNSRKLATVLYFGGPKLQDIYYSIPNHDTVPSGKNEFQYAMELLDSQFIPKSNPIFERHLFRLMKQEPGESSDKFISRLRQQASRCGFDHIEKKDIMEVNLVDQFVEGCSSDKLRKRFLEKDSLSIKEVADIARSLEIVTQQAVNFSKTDLESINRVADKKQNVPMSRSSTGTKLLCYRCGSPSHLARANDCPARTKICSKCSLMGHYSKCCRTKPTSSSSEMASNNKTSGNGKSYYVQDENMGNGDSSDYVFSLEPLGFKRNRFDGTVDCEIGGVKLNFVIDSGSTCDVITDSTWEYLKTHKIRVGRQSSHCSKKLFTYGSTTPLETLGEFEAWITANNRTIRSTVIVIRGRGPPLLGKSSALKLKVLDLYQPQINHINTLEGQTIGKLSNFQLKLQIDKTVCPVVQPLRRIPIPLRRKVEERILQLERDDIIEKVNGPSKWVSPIVPIPKGNGIRLCLDMRQANKAILKSNHPLPTIEDLLPELGEAQYFSKLDIAMAFHQIELAEESRDITTFCSHMGLYRFKRLMFGVNSAPQDFQKIMENLLRRCEGVFCFVDDVLVYGNDRTTHDTNLQKVLQILKQRGIVLNKEKCEIGKTTVTFLGHIISKNNIKPSFDRVEALKTCREPTNLMELQGFLGLLNYVSRFLPNVSTLTEPLRELTHKGIPFKWGSRQRTAFNEVKALLSSDLALGCFNPNDETTVMADASPVGLGAVLIQKSQDNIPRIICYVSKSLSDVEKRYSQTEKEALALVWACERLKIYLIGKKFTLLTDHKPLEVIFGGKNKPCARIERWLLRMQSFDFNVQYIEGKNNIADPLSRLFTVVTPPIEISDNYISHLVSFLVPRGLSLDQIKQESGVDPVINEVRTSLQTGVWKKDESILLPYRAARSELSDIDGILLKATKIVIPASLQKQVLNLAHEGHPGIVEMKSRLRSKVWWPGVDKAAEKTVKACRGCQMTATSESPEKISSTILPERPWEKIAMDVLGPFPNGVKFLVIVDYFSRFMEVIKLKDMDSKSIIKALDPIFARYGYPDRITTDNGSCFVSTEIETFFRDCNISHHKTTPLHPAANGTVERLNPGITRRLQIANVLKLDWEQELNKYLLMYRNHRHQTTGASPAELFFGRHLKDKVPSLPSHLQSTKHPEEVKERDKIQKIKKSEYADHRRRAKEKSLHPGDLVLMKQRKKDKFSTTFGGTPVKVVGKIGNSVTVKGPHGNLIKRNSSHFKPYVGSDNRSSEESDHVIEDNTCDDSSTSEESDVILRRSQRTSKKPSYLSDYIT